MKFLVVWSPAMCCASVQVPDALFFLGVLFAVGGLERVGLLKAPCKVTLQSDHETCETCRKSCGISRNLPCS